MTEARDFSLPPHMNSNSSVMPPPLHLDLEAAAQPPQSTQTDQVDGHAAPLPLNSPTESVRLQRRPVRSSTAKTYRPERWGQSWQPGQEPGIDTSAPQHAHPSSASVVPELHEECDITVVDFSTEDMQMHRLDNRSLVPFMAEPRPDWVVCRWISVNGLSWDVIKLLGSNKGLHRLAIEDMMNPRNRTKADWYSDHTYRECLFQYSCDLLSWRLSGLFSSRLILNGDMCLLMLQYVHFISYMLCTKYNIPRGKGSIISRRSLTFHQWSFHCKNSFISTRLQKVSQIARTWRKITPVAIDRSTTRERGRARRRSAARFLSLYSRGQ